MELKRTANAGILLTLDGVSILLDGVCREVKPYPATPPKEKALLTACWPDVVAFTHAHKDHYDPAYAGCYKQLMGRVVLGPATVRGSMMPITVDGVSILPVPSRHIGAAGRGVSHASFVIKGSKTVWFLGDAAPMQFKNVPGLPSPDVLIVPYAYANTASSWAFTKSFNAQVVLLHMPDVEEDTIGLWSAVRKVVGQDPLMIPNMSETITIV